jgi:hypothetical protein
VEEIEQDDDGNGDAERPQQDAAHGKVPFRLGFAFPIQPNGGVIVPWRRRAATIPKPGRLL